MTFPVNLPQLSNGNNPFLATDKYWMEQAYQLALQAQDANEIPVGALLINNEGRLLSAAYNQVEHLRDPTAHAEMLALRQATQHYGNHRLLQTTMYVTLEPCPMCAGALIHARVSRLVFAARDFKTGAAGSVYNLLNGKVLNHKIQVDEGIMAETCGNLLSHFFKEKRNLI